MKSLAILSFVIGLSGLPATVAAAPKPVELQPINHLAAELTIVNAEGEETVYSPQQLETFDSYALSTMTPWREVAANFEGVLLVDLLRAHGLASADAITVTAENDYKTTIPRELWESVDVLIATRVDGRAHTRRARGPIQFVMDIHEMEASPVANEGHLVWMAARIEAAD